MNNVLSDIKTIMTSKLKYWILSLIHPKGFLFSNRIHHWLKKTLKDPRFSSYDSQRHQLIHNPKSLQGLIGIGHYPQQNTVSDSIVFVFPGNTETPFHYRKLIKTISNDNNVEVISYFNPGVAGTPGQFINELQIKNLHIRAIRQHINDYQIKYNNTPRIFLYGYSLGGAIALLIAKDLINIDKIKPKVFIHASFDSTSSVASQWAPYHLILGIALAITTLLSSIVISPLFILPLGLVSYGILVYTPYGIQFTQLMIKKTCYFVLKRFKMNMSITHIAKDLLQENLIIISHPEGDQTIPSPSSLVEQFHKKTPSIHKLNPLKRYKHKNPHSLELEQLICPESKSSGLSLLYKFLQESKDNNQQKK
ncbi:MAG TPA: hypothetical protein QF353_00170 [Gammaproteobacteria bacterium]|nr:hypothetical protein [Gammaproteobacteria bacterium]